MNWMYRCANDLFGYCTGEPKWEKEPETAGVQNAVGDRQYELVKVPLTTPCTKDKAKCKKYRAFSQVVDKQLEAINA